MSKEAQSTAGESSSIEEKVYQLIVTELDQGRDVLQLYKQVASALPIKTFDDLRKAFGKEGRVAFRDETAPIEMFETLIPEFVFPIMDTRALIVQLTQLVQAFPDDIGYDIKKEGTRIMMGRRQLAKALIPSVNRTNSSALAAEFPYHLSVNKEAIKKQLTQK